MSKYKSIEESVVSAKRFVHNRKNYLFLTVFYCILAGIEYAVIFPTIWNYLQTLGVTQEYYLGITVSSYSASAMIAQIIGGRLSDKFPNNTVGITIVSIIAMVAGNFQYIMAGSVTNIIAARFICGLGTAAGTAMMAEICRITRRYERTKMLSIVYAGRQFGIMIGPALQIALNNIKFSMGIIHVTPLNGAGFLMGILWTLFIVVALIFMRNLTTEFHELQQSGQFLDEEDDPILPQINTPINTSYGTYQSISSTTNNNVRILVTSATETGTSINSDGRDSDLLLPKDGAPNARQYISEFMNDHVILLLVVPFLTFFAEIGMETVVPIIVQKNFGFNELQTSILYTCGGILALLTFALMTFSRHFRKCDFIITVIGCVLMLSGLLWLMFWIPHFQTSNIYYLPHFVVGLSFLYVGFPFASTASNSLFSKCLSESTQGLGQGVRRSITYLGLILGPAWFGSTIHQPYLCLSIAAVLLVLILIMSAFSARVLIAMDQKSKLTDLSSITSSASISTNRSTQSQ